MEEESEPTEQDFTKLEGFFGFLGGAVTGIITSAGGPDWLISLFADGIIERYSRYHCKVISDKEYFKLQLS